MLHIVRVPVVAITMNVMTVVVVPKDKTVLTERAYATVCVCR